MKTIFKLLFLALIVPMVIHSCRDDEFTMGEKEPSFELYNTTLASNVLYPTMADNAFRLVWDNSLGGAEYTVEVSSDPEFSSTTVLGTSSTTTLTTTIGALNEAALGAGLNPYQSQKLYFRVTAGSNVSNVISTDLTTYPVAKPIITSPSAGTSIVLDKEAPTTVATSVSWTDYNYGTEVSYLVEIAKKGSAEYVAAGSISDDTALDLITKDFNDAVLKLGLPVEVASEIDIRISASTTSVGGTLLAVSEPVTITVTPYVAFKDLFLVGEATAPGWNTNNNNPALFRDPNNTNKFYYTGYFNAGGFKVLEKLGDNTWHPQWGPKDGVLIASNPDASNEPGTFVIPTAGYYTFEMDIMEKTFSITPYDASGATNHTDIGIIGDATPDGWNSDTDLVQSTFDAHQWSLHGVTLGAGEIKFRANNDWAINWGAGTLISGKATLDGPNIKVEQAGVYDIFFNDLDGSFILVKKD